MVGVWGKVCGSTDSKEVWIRSNGWSKASVEFEWLAESV